MVSHNQCRRFDLSPTFLPKGKGDVWKLLPTFALVALVTSLGCGSEGAGEGEITDFNFQCPGRAVSIAGECTEDEERCEPVGALVPVERIALEQAEEIFEARVFVADDARVHYCYTGLSGNTVVAYYGVQLDVGLTDEVSLVSASGYAPSCSNLFVSKDGRPYIFSEKTGEIIVRGLNGLTWETWDLQSLVSDEGDSIKTRGGGFSDLFVDESGTVYLAASFGWESSRPESVITSIQSGKEELLGFEHVPGYMPQFHRAEGEVAIVDAEPMSQFFGLYTSAGALLGSWDGSLPRVADSRDGEGAALAWLDTNERLHAGFFDDARIEERFVVSTSAHRYYDSREIPWEIALGENEDIHLLAEKELSDGETGLVYQSSRPGEFEPRSRIVTEGVAMSMSGERRYGISIDRCQRPTIAVVVDGRSKAEKNGKIAIDVFEGR